MFDTPRVRRPRNGSPNPVSPASVNESAPRPLSVFGLDAQIGPLIDRLVDRAAERVIPAMTSTITRGLVLGIVVGATVATTVATLSAVVALSLIGVLS